MQPNFFNVILADAAPAAPATTASPVPANGTATTTPPQQGALLQFAPMVILVIVFYFILIRPQQQRAKQQQKMLAALKAGDKVVTASGIIGVVTSVREKSVSLRSADAKFEVTKSSVTDILDAGTAIES